MVILMQVLLSAGVTFAALFIILSNKYPPGAQKWAYTALGMILGYWLKGG